MSKVRDLKTEYMAIYKRHKELTSQFKKREITSPTTKDSIRDTARRKSDIAAYTNMERELTTRLEKIIETLRKDIATTTDRIDRRSKVVDLQKMEVLKKNKELEEQDVLLQKTNVKLVSRKQQNVLSKEKNQYRRVLIVFLVLLNLILAGYLTHLFLHR
tara:strand:+ start:13178 stop:13654 length:477 start_codon:yes stop_codon:yes gene_type:complete